MLKSQGAMDQILSLTALHTSLQELLIFSLAYDAITCTSGCPRGDCLDWSACHLCNTGIKVLCFAVARPFTRNSYINCHCLHC